MAIIYGFRQIANEGLVSDALSYSNYLTQFFCMQIPLKLQAQLNAMPSTEIEEIKRLFASLPSHDNEIQALIADNLDALIEVLTCSEELLAA